MPEATATTATEATPAAVENTAEASSARVMEFAKQLKNEHSGEQPAQAENDTETETTSEDRPAAEAKPLDRDAVAKAFKAGDIAKLAELLGEKETGKIKNSDWAKYRQKNTEARRQAEETQARLEQERAALNQERQQLLQAHSKLGKVAQALDRGDYITAFEEASGKPIKEIVDILADDLTDSNKREARLLRQQIERQEQERQAEKRQEAQERENREREQAISRYKVTLKETLAADPQIAPILSEYGDAFADLVFTEQAKHSDSEQQMPIADATKNVVKLQIAHLRRALKVFGSLLNEPEQETPGQKPAKQGSPGAPKLAPRKSVTTGQGAATNTREMSPQERRAMFARQLKAELSGA